MDSELLRLSTLTDSIGGKPSRLRGRISPRRSISPRNLFKKFGNDDDTFNLDSSYYVSLIVAFIGMCALVYSLVLPKTATNNADGSIKHSDAFIMRRTSYFVLFLAGCIRSYYLFKTNDDVFTDFMLSGVIAIMSGLFLVLNLLGKDVLGN